VFHCFQYAGYDDLAATWETAPWITEGQAFWVAAEIVGQEQAWITPAYAEWLCRPEISLWKRLRPAMGFYSTVATHGPGDLWTRLDDMLGLSREAAVAAAGIPASDALRFVATGRMRDDGSFDAPWTLDGAGQSAAPCRETASANPGAPWEWSGDVQSFASGPPFIVTVGGDVLRADARGSVGAFEFSDGTLVPWSGAFAAVYCLLDGGCECPDGRSIGEATVAPGRTAVAVGGGSGTISASLFPFTLEDACVEVADVPRMTYVGDPEIELAGGVCVLDAGDLILSIGWEPEYDALPQPEPYPRMKVFIFVRAVPGTWNTGSMYVAPTGGEFRLSGDGGLVITMSEDLLTGTFTTETSSGSYSCPRLWTPAEAAAGPP
jgi:hypothetical protein